MFSKSPIQEAKNLSKIRRDVQIEIQIEIQSHLRDIDNSY